MIDSSIFTYLPPASFRPNYAFLGFFRSKEEITRESWGRLRKEVYNKVFCVLEEKFDMCGCSLASIQFTSNETELGVILKKLPRVMKLLCEIAEEHLDEKQIISKTNYPEAIVRKAIDDCIRSICKRDIKNLSSLEEQQRRQIEINEFAVKALCKMAVEAEINKEHLLKQVRRAKKEGYLASKDYYDLQKMLKPSFDARKFV